MPCDENRVYLYLGGKMNLPTWTRDAGTMKRDIDEHGYCLVKEALTPEQLAEARERLSEQAEAERTGERKALTYAYQPPMFRPFENYPMELLPEVYEEASQELLDLLGFKVWFGVGHLGDRNAERISRDTPIIGELKP